MKALVEILKVLASFLFAGLLGLIGLAMVRLVRGVPFVDSEGNIAWITIITGIAFFVVGYFIFNFGVKIFEK